MLDWDSMLLLLVCFFSRLEQSVGVCVILNLKQGPPLLPWQLLLLLLLLLLLVGVSLTVPRLILLLCI